MKVIVIEHPHEFTPDQFPQLAIALGFFDGIHKGHQKVISAVKDIAHQLDMKSAVMTFNPHPSAVLGKKIQHIRYITPLQDKISIIEEMGVDYLFIVHFTEEFAALLPQEFVDQYLININVRHVVAGFDYSYGKYGEGTMETLPLHCRGRFTQTIIEKQKLEDEKVSSTRIRKCLADGDFLEYRHLTGRYYMTRGIVIHGEKRGRQLGFPTANMDLKDDYIFPATGVYAVQVKVRGIWYKGICNVGYKPTFHKEKPDVPSVEVHILDYSGEIYGDTAEIQWNKRLRSEKKFSGLEELVKQIGIDKMQAEEYFKEIE
ncbi:riboflavin biosynthesis protein RibF [Bacillus sp. MUM 13]|nr:bifunctional riboflavin kinase/FAD synthetase [Bacillus sp. MUM 13]OIK15324.1 riboflavin biosynthesis protein RibF [Bacillus sp. MUM 13]